MALSDAYTPAVVGQVAQVVEFGSAENLPAVQFVHAVSLATAHAAERNAPAAQTLQVEQASAPGADQLTPGEHALQTASAVAVQ